MAGRIQDAELRYTASEGNSVDSAYYQRRRQRHDDRNRDNEPVGRPVLSHHSLVQPLQRPNMGARRLDLASQKVLDGILTVISSHDQDHGQQIGVEFVAVEVFVGDNCQAHIALHNPDDLHRLEDVDIGFGVDGIVDDVPHPQAQVSRNLFGKQDAVGAGFQ